MSTSNQGRQSPESASQTEAQIGTTADPDNKVATQIYENGKKCGEQWLERLRSNPKESVEEHTAVSLI
jgi:hypothetical protein